MMLSMKRFRPLSAILCLALCSLGFASCARKAPVSVSPDAVPPATASAFAAEGPAKITVRKPRHGPADHRVVVMLGEEYASRPRLLEPLYAEYGIAGFGGMVVPLSWPGSFLVEKRPRLSVLSEIAREPDTTILVTVGAPEGTVRELEKIRNTRPGMKILTLFPLDEPLPVEAVSDLVLDFKASDQPLADENAPSGPLLDDSSMGVILLALALAGEDLSSGVSPLDAVSGALDRAGSLARQKKEVSGWSFSSYVDPETGLRSRNHLVLSVPARSAPVLASSPGGAQ